MSAENVTSEPVRACIECGRDAEDELCTECAERPHVCPGCYAVGEQECAPGCIDAEIEAEHRERIESGDYDRVEEEDGDWEIEP